MTTKECPRPEKMKLAQNDAEQRAKALRNQWPDIVAYHCECGAWHLGNNQRRFTKRVRTAINTGNQKRRHTKERTKRRERRR